MSGKKILTIGYEFTSDDVVYTSFDSKISLLDWDIIIFFPDISFYYELADDTFKGKPALSESHYSRVKEQAEHWRREILNAFNSNRTIIIILNELQEIYIDSGERKHSETDGIRKVTRLFDSYSNYDAIPLRLKPINSNGTSIKLARNAELISSYWNEFSDLSEYKVIIEEQLSGTLLLTEQEKIAGAYARNKSSNGTIILLPYVNFNKEISYEQKFLKSIIEIDSILKQPPVLPDKAEQQSPELLEKTPEQSPDLIDETTNQSLDLINKALEPSPDLIFLPRWLKDSSFELPNEIKLKKELLNIESKFEAIRKEEEAIKSKIILQGKYKRLLYEQGKALEEVILNSLQLLGFESVKHHNSESAFDAIFQSEEGRFMIAVVGKDNEEIELEQLRQLELKILEDFAHEEVNEMAKGILFGNAFRLQELNNRKDFFTDKCVIAAKRSRIALIRTPYLFEVVKYLSDGQDARYAKKCREAILQCEGELGNFPVPPKISLPKW